MSQQQQSGFLSYGPPPTGYAPPPPPPPPSSLSHRSRNYTRQHQNQRFRPYPNSANHINGTNTYGYGQHQPPYPQQQPHQWATPSYQTRHAYHYAPAQPANSRFIAPNAPTPQSYYKSPSNPVSMYYEMNGYYGTYNAEPQNIPETSTVPPPPDPFPTSSSWKCETCDKSFNNSQQHKEHMDLHEKCPECEFDAAPKTLRKHIDEIHHPPAIRVGDSSEEIAKWIEERKRNWPSGANIARKRAEATAVAEKAAIPRSPPPKRKQPKSNMPCKYFVKGRCFRGQNCPHLHVLPKTGGEVVPPEQSPTAVNAGATVVRSTLLRKLLNKDIQQERRILLQCITHLVENMKE